MSVLVAALLAACVLAAAIIGLRFAAKRRNGAAGPAADAGGSRAAKTAASARSCPLCGSILDPGQRVKSNLFPGKSHRIMHILGCPNCWPARPYVPRLCPVCGRELAPDGWVVARYFERQGVAGSPTRGHIHVLGCASCRRGLD